jgi:hypothetical protein
MLYDALNTASCLIRYWMKFKIYVTLNCCRVMIMAPGAEFMQESLNCRRLWWIWGSGEEASDILKLFSLMKLWETWFYTEWYTSCKSCWFQLLLSYCFCSVYCTGNSCIVLCLLVMYMLLPYLGFFCAFSSVVRQMPGYNSLHFPN